MTFPLVVMTSYTPVGENVPEQSLSHPYGYQPAYRGYQLVPAEPSYESRPTLEAPPPYTESRELFHNIYKLHSSWHI